MYQSLLRRREILKEKDALNRQHSQQQEVGVPAQ